MMSGINSSNRRIRTSAAASSSAATNAESSHERVNGHASLSSEYEQQQSRLLLPSAVAAAATSADTSKYAKRKRRRSSRQCSQLAAIFTTIGFTLMVFSYLHRNDVNSNSMALPLYASKRDPSHLQLRDQLLAPLPSAQQHLPHNSHHNHNNQQANDNDAAAAAAGASMKTSHELERAFDTARRQVETPTSTAHLASVLHEWMEAIDRDTLNNLKGGIRWTRPYLLPPLRKQADQDDVVAQQQHQHDGQQNQQNHNFRFGGGGGASSSRTRTTKEEAAFFKATNRMRSVFAWEREWDELQLRMQQQQNERNAGAASTRQLGPKVDYTDASLYVYPQLPDQKQLFTPPDAAVYPPLQTLSVLMDTWPQDEDYDFGKHQVIHEQLLHFNFSNPVELKMAQVLRDHELPFKLYNVPELVAATIKWTDDYVSAGFGGGGGAAANNGLFGFGNAEAGGGRVPPASGVAQESPNNYFAFFTPKQWNVHNMGLPPTRNSDWTYAKWAKHARYADAAQLSFDQPHVYWQAGVDRMERYSDSSKWTFISRDLPSFASPTENFFVFHPQEQKGIQCRFGERGVVAATHYDGGRNFVGMITGAKRYILSPPNQCPKLGVFTSKKSPIYRHSLLNFAHIQYLKDDASTKEQARGMSDEEREWLERASQALSVETVLKAGEALYIPSHWFHYIISVQKSAQCNVRSGINHEGHPVFGGRETVEQCREEAR